MVHNQVLLNSAIFTPQMHLHKSRLILDYRNSICWTLATDYEVKVDASGHLVLLFLSPFRSLLFNLAPVNTFLRAVKLHLEEQFVPYRFSPTSNRFTINFTSSAAF